MPPKLNEAYQSAMLAAHRCCQAGQLDQALRHLERAHVIGQRYVMPHVASHWAMLRIALCRRSAAAVCGQLIRVVLGAAGSAVGIVPTGNTGGTDISMFARRPLAPDIAALFLQDEQ